MSDFAPPAGPPPPKVPAGWKAVWNKQYDEWFYVNIYTKQSQWDKPTEPIYPPGEFHDTPPDGPPAYSSGDAKPVAAEKTGLSSNNPYAGPEGATSSNYGGAGAPGMAEDERLARQLQAEEDARSQGGRGNPAGSANDYYAQGPGGPAPYGQQQNYGPQQGYGQQQPDPYTGQYDSNDKGKKKSGLAGKLLSKLTSSSGSRPPSHGPGFMGGGQHYGHAGPQYGYGASPMMYQQPGRRPGGGMGAGGAAALGVGGGLVGGMLLADAMDGHDGGDDGGFGGDDGGGFGGDDGGFGGGDMGGGDFGGDF